MMVVYDEVSSSNTILQRGVYNDESLNFFASMWGDRMMSARPGQVQDMNRWRTLSALTGSISSQSGKQMVMLMSINYRN